MEDYDLHELHINVIIFHFITDEWDTFANLIKMY